MTSSNSRKGGDARSPARGSPLAPTSEISRRLRLLYDSVSNEEIPDQLLDLLQKLDEVDDIAPKRSKDE